MAQSPTTTSSEIVLSDDEFEHSNSVRLLLDLLVHGVVGRSSYAVDHIANAIDLSLKYDCHCGYEHCLSYIESAIARGLPPASSAMCELFVLAGQLDEARIARLVVRALAKAQLKINVPAHLCWQVGQVAGTPPQYLCAMERALLPSLHRNYTYSFPSADAAVERFENGLANFDGMCRCGCTRRALTVRSRASHDYYCEAHPGRSPPRTKAVAPSTFEPTSKRRPVPR